MAIRKEGTEPESQMHYMSRLSPDKSHIMGQLFFLWTVKSTQGSQFIYARATDRGELTNIFYFNTLKYFRGCKGLHKFVRFIKQVLN